MEQTIDLVKFDVTLEIEKRYRVKTMFGVVYEGTLLGFSEHRIIMRNKQNCPSGHPNISIDSITEINSLEKEMEY